MSLLFLFFQLQQKKCQRRLRMFVILNICQILKSVTGVAWDNASPGSLLDISFFGCIAGELPRAQLLLTLSVQKTSLKGTKKGKSDPVIQIFIDQFPPTFIFLLYYQVIQLIAINGQKTSTASHTHRYKGGLSVRCLIVMAQKTTSFRLSLRL